MLEEIHLHAQCGEDFGFETTLSGRGHLSLLRDLKQRGYQVHLFFLWISTVDLALTRIRDRVSEGVTTFLNLSCDAGLSVHCETFLFAVSR
jgi:predicted ABC-type ATPase